MPEFTSTAPAPRIGKYAGKSAPKPGKAAGKRKVAKRKSLPTGLINNAPTVLAR
jgi:hypothetical protein